MRIGFASDHRGYKLKQQLISEFIKRGFEVEDFGTNSEESCDYPDYAFELGENVGSHIVDFGVAICGSGIGISIACNKVDGVRCAKVSNKEEAKVTRNDNNSNIVAFSEAVPVEEAFDIVMTFINTDFSEEEKHHRRVNKIIEFEAKN